MSDTDEAKESDGMLVDSSPKNTIELGTSKFNACLYNHLIHSVTYFYE